MRGSRPSRRTFTASPKPRPRTSANCFTATRAWRRSCSEPRDSFQKRTTILPREKSYADDNTKTNEYLFRRVAIEDVVDAHLLAIDRASAIGFGKYIISATTPFLPGDCAALRVGAPAVVSLRAPGWEDEYSRRGWRMFPSIDRVYDNALARQDLGWRPKWDFAAIVERLRDTGDIRGPLAKQIGVKGYHAERFEGAPYPVTGAPG